jgi:hypothetical protein
LAVDEMAGFDPSTEGLREPELRKRGARRLPATDITIMLVTNRDLAKLRKFEKSGVLPEGWRDKPLVAEN